MTRNSLVLAMALSGASVYATPRESSGAARDIASDAGLRGDPTAIAAARAMVDAMGGSSIWKPLQSLRLVHEWFPWDRSDSYVETETLDLTGPRSRADRRSEINHAVRSYSPEGGGWRLQNGELSVSSRESLASDLARAPFNFFRLVSAVAKDDAFFEVRWGEGDIPGTRRLEFRGPDGRLGGWVILDVDGEPIVKATPEYRYVLGPLQRFGNLRLPAWGVYDNGTTRYEMRAAEGGREPPDPALFLPPPAAGRPVPPSASVGERRALTDGSFSSRAPAWSPDGTRIAFEASRNGLWSIQLLAVESGAVEGLTDATTNARYPAWSPDGRRIVFVCDRRGEPDLCVLDVSTRALEQVIEGPGEELWPAWSPDGEEIAFTRQTGPAIDLAIVNLATRGSGTSALTVPDARWPRWSPDGQHVAFFSRRDTEGLDDDIYTLHRRSGEVSRLTESSGHDFCPAWSPAGDRLVIASVDAESGRSLRIIDREGRELARLGRGHHRVSEPTWSPDGRSIAYTAAVREGQQYQLFVEPVARD